MFKIISTLSVAILSGKAQSLDSKAPVICEDVCETLTACKNSGQGSYCKPGHVSVCFGLYEQNNGTICYYQEDPSCEQSKPVECRVQSVVPPIPETSLNSSNDISEVRASSFSQSANQSGPSV
jgi:hypothetical protein